MLTAAGERALERALNSNACVRHVELVEAVFIGGGRPLIHFRRRARSTFGVAEDTGALEVGKWADVISVEGNPLEDITALEQVRFVMKAGVVFKPAPPGR